MSKRVNSVRSQATAGFVRPSSNVTLETDAGSERRQRADSVLYLRRRNSN